MVLIGVPFRSRNTAYECRMRWHDPFPGISTPPRRAQTRNALDRAAVLIVPIVGRLDEAAASYRRAIAIKPDYAEAHSNLGNNMGAQGKPSEAIACYERAIALKPDYAEAHNNLGNELTHVGRLDEAIARYQQALTLKPDYAEAHSNLGNVFMHQGRLDEAKASYERATALKPDYAEGHSNLGNVLGAKGDLDGARACYEKALALKPDYAEGYLNLGNVFGARCMVDEARACYERSLELKPDYPQAIDNLLFSLNYSDSIPPAVIYAEHARLGARLEALHKRMPVDYANGRDPNRRLRVGYVSPDFHQHSVAFFLEPLLRAHNHDLVEVFCYAEVICRTR